jgi:hypothetical protein
MNNSVQVGDTFSVGEKVERSGIYRVNHDYEHAQSHEVTCVYGGKFPPCRTCKNPTFTLVRAAQHIERNEHFKNR